MPRFEVILLAFSLVCWTASIASGLGLISVAGSLPLELYPYYSACAAAGFLLGNVFVWRRGRGSIPTRTVSLYLLGPGGFVYFLRALAPRSVQTLAPLVPLLGFAIYVVFLLVPFTLGRPKPRREISIGGSPGTRRDDSSRG